MALGQRLGDLKEFRAVIGVIIILLKEGCRHAEHQFFSFIADGLVVMYAPERPVILRMDDLFKVFLFVIFIQAEFYRCGVLKIRVYRKQRLLIRVKVINVP